MRRISSGLLVAGLLCGGLVPATAAQATAQRSFTVYSAWVRLTASSPRKRDDFAGSITRSGNVYTLSGTLKDRHGEGSSAYLYISWSPRSAWIGFDPGNDRVGAPSSQRVVARFRSPASIRLRVCDKPKTASNPGCGNWKTVVG